eukprot:1817828-Pleurochrysis_carterae.AAC.1
MIASFVPNTHSVEDDSQSWLTNKKESPKVMGTQRTLRRTRWLRVALIGVNGAQWHVPDSCALLRLAIHISDYVRAWFRVHHVGQARMYVPRAAALSTTNTTLDWPVVSGCDIVGGGDVADVGVNCASPWCRSRAA